MFKHIFALSVGLLAAALAFSVYVESGQTAESVYWSVYAFGAVFLPGIFTAYPGFKKQRDSRGFEIKVPRGRDLSKFQAITIFSWIVGVGLIIVYVTQF